MKNTFVVAPLAVALSFSTPIAAQAVPQSAPQAIPVVHSVPKAVDTPYPGVIDLTIDARDTQRGVYRVTETIPVVAGSRQLTLLIPLWLPGNHSPVGPVVQFADIRFAANGKPVSWRRDPVDVNAFHLDLPAGASNVTATFVHTSPLQTSEGRITMTQEMLNLQWEKMSLYPAGYYVRQIKVKPTVTFPDGWRVFTALDGQSAPNGTISWDATRYDTLVDSPIFAGKYAQKFDLGHNVSMDVVADKPELLAIKPENLAHFRKLVDEALANFGARHFDHYDFLLALTDRMGGIGLEHHRSSENQYEPRSLIDWDKMDWDHNVIPHEFTHSWNGKYRRPADLWTPDYQQTKQDSLLWMYEGQTQFWGIVLAARSGVQSKNIVLGSLANWAGGFAQGEPGRAWRSVEDTTNDPIINKRQAQPYRSLQRAEDYYTEGALVWLEADQIIRAGTKGRKGIDDFAKAFFGMRDGDWGELTYNFDTIVNTLNDVYPYDWAAFLETRIGQPGQPAPLKGIEMAGYKLVWKDTPNPYDDGRMKGSHYLDLTYSLGVNLNKEGAVTSTLWDGPAFNAGIVNGAKILAVNGEAYDADTIKQAITAAKGSKDPITLLVQRGDHFLTVPVAVASGLRYPWLEPVSKGEQGLDRLLAPRTK